MHKVSEQFGNLGFCSDETASVMLDNRTFHECGVAGEQIKRRHRFVALTQIAPCLRFTVQQIARTNFIQKRAQILRGQRVSANIDEVWIMMRKGFSRVAAAIAIFQTEYFHALDLARVCCVVKLMKTGLSQEINAEFLSEISDLVYFCA
jgi:hypothetical protein